jgi:hypothetical protein
VVALLLAICLLMDATLVCTRFIRMISLPTTWTVALGAFRNERQLEPPKEEALEHWIDIRAIADATDSLGRFVQCPFLILFIMILARSAYFDQWRWPLSLTVVIGANSVVVFISALRMRMAAEKARRQAIHELKKHLPEWPSPAPETATMPPASKTPADPAAATGGRLRSWFLTLLIARLSDG